MVVREGISSQQPLAPGVPSNAISFGSPVAVHPLVSFSHAGLFPADTPGSTFDWRYLGPALTAQDVPLLRFDFPGHGKSCRGLVEYPAQRPFIS